MSDEAEVKTDQKQQQSKNDQAGSVTNPSQENQIHNNRPQDTSKKNPSRESEPHPRGQEKPEDEKRHAS
jgi:hypothetical protein